MQVKPGTDCGFYDDQKTYFAARFMNVPAKEAFCRYIALVRVQCNPLQVFDPELS